MSRCIFSCHNRELLLASIEQKPGMLLNFLHFTGQLPTKKNYLAQNVSSAEAEKTRAAILAEYRGRGQKEIGGGDLT